MSTAAVPAVATHFVVALRSEARPLVERYRLEPFPSPDRKGSVGAPGRKGSAGAAGRKGSAGAAGRKGSVGAPGRRGSVGAHDRRPPFPTYRGDGIWLVVSGIGKAAAAAATGYLYALAGEPRCGVWLNVGVAGHRQLAVGEGRLAHRVSDTGSRRNWYPPIPFAPPCPSAEVRTVDEAERHFADDAFYEMEAAGFYAAASRLASAELVHVFKVVSDNARAPAEELDGSRVEALIASRLDEIEQLRRAVAELAAELAGTQSPPGELGRYLERWHFTLSERRRLERLLGHWRAVSERPELWSEKLERLESAGEVLAGIEQAVETELRVAPLGRP